MVSAMNLGVYMSKFSIYSASALCTVFLAGALHAVTPEAALNAALVPKADLVVSTKDGKINSSAIYKEIKPLFTQLQEEFIKNDATGYKKLKQFETLLKAEGLDEDNIDVSAVSCSLGGLYAKFAPLLNNNTGEPPQVSFDDISLVSASSLKKPVTEDTLKKVVESFAKTFGEKELEELNGLTTKDFTHAGVKGLNLIITPQKDNVPIESLARPVTITLALLADNKVLFLGLEKDVKAAIDRAKAGTKAEVSAELKKLLDTPVAGGALAKHDAYFAMVVPKLFRDWVAKTSAQFMDGPMAGQLPAGVLPGIEAAKNLQGVRSTASYGQKADVNINFVLESPERAKAVKDLLEINVLGMAKMTLFQMLGKATPFTESLKSSADGSSTTLSCSVTADDCKTFVDFIKTRLSSGGQPAPFLIEEDVEIEIKD